MMRHLLRKIGYFILHPTGTYLVNTTMYDDLHYKVYTLYEYYRVFMLFNITIHKDTASTLSEKKYQTWLFDYYDKITIRDYCKN